MKSTRSKMKIRTMNRNVLKDPRHKDFNYNTIALHFFGFFNETTLSWQLKHLFSTTFFFIFNSVISMQNISKTKNKKA